MISFLTQQNTHHIIQIFRVGTHTHNHHYRKQQFYT